ncbi:hypothetical protein BV25DRAFT_1920157 [Artomyces pyxidatus]|uniref:Uncharacterized protein n=1 Tax=Artomyces pyxidatus TaxID=48021 RepID=A0ACB8SND0_9AGAM|nr:hypothetical protein BV25DRAFT_1920157 [Artomyces pyxidatus]
MPDISAVAVITSDPDQITKPSEPTSPSSIRIAGPPFDDAHADIILRSSDNVDFHVHKLLLSMASPVFSDMFSAPRLASSSSSTGDEMKDGLPIIHVTEDEHTIELMLKFCYPRTCCPSPSLNDFDSISRAMHVANKYQVDFICDAVVFRLEDDVTPVDSENVERLYALAWMLRMRRFVLAAARRTLSSPEQIFTDFEELGHIPALALTRLARYQCDCGKAATSSTSDLTWIDSGDLPSMGRCGTCSNSQYSYSGWTAYLADINARLTRAPSHRTCIDPISSIASAVNKSSQCKNCSRITSSVFAALASFQERLAAEVKRRVSLVDLETPF